VPTLHPGDIVRSETLYQRIGTLLDLFPTKTMRQLLRKFQMCPNLIGFCSKPAEQCPMVIFPRGSG